MNIEYQRWFRAHKRNRAWILIFPDSFCTFPIWAPEKKKNFSIATALHLGTEREGKKSSRFFWGPAKRRKDILRPRDSFSHPILRNFGVRSLTVRESFRAVPSSICFFPFPYKSPITDCRNGLEKEAHRYFGLFLGLFRGLFCQEIASCAQEEEGFSQKRKIGAYDVYLLYRKCTNTMPITRVRKMEVVGCFVFRLRKYEFFF